MCGSALHPSAPAEETWTWLSEAEGWPDPVKAMQVQDGVLELIPGTSVWWGAFHAPFLFRTVEGDFLLRARVRTLGLHSAFPVRPDSGSLAGLLVRAPAPADGWSPRDERYWSLTTGLASGPGGTQPSMEISTTVHGESGIEWFAGREGWVELAAARLGRYVMGLHRFPNEPWTFTRDEARLGALRAPPPGLGEERPDLPSRLQVGLTAMTNWPTVRQDYRALAPDARPGEFNRTIVSGEADELRAQFHLVQLTRPRVAVASPADWPDTALLAALGLN